VKEATNQNKTESKMSVISPALSEGGSIRSKIEEEIGKIEDLLLQNEPFLILC
jgi:hypothetical protein